MPGMGGDGEGASNVKLLGMLVRKKMEMTVFFIRIIFASAS